MYEWMNFCILYLHRSHSGTVTLHSHHFLLLHCWCGAEMTDGLERDCCHVVAVGVIRQCVRCMCCAF